MNLSSESIVGKLDITHDRRKRFLRVFTFMEEDRQAVDVSQIVPVLRIKNSSGTVILTLQGADFSFEADNQIIVDRAASSFASLSRLEGYYWEFIDGGSGSDGVPLFEGHFKLV